MTHLSDRIAEMVAHLRRRRVFRAGGLYWISALAVLGALDLLRDLVPWLDRSFPSIVLAAILLFPAALWLAWVFDWTSSGLRLHRAGPDDHLGPGQRIGLLSVLTLVSLGFGWAVLTLWTRSEEARSVGVESLVARTGLDPNRIAVLYFDDRSPGGALTYLAEGLTEGVIDALSGVDELRVTSKNGVRPYRTAPVPTDSMARQLGVGTLVTGSVAGEPGGRIRVDAQLVDVTEGDRQLWSGTFEGTAGDALALRSELVSEISRTLRRNLGVVVRERQAFRETGDDQAWRLYHEGRRLLASTREDVPLEYALGLMDQAEAVLAEAQELDPEWAAPAVERGWLAYERSRLVSPSAGRVDVADSAALLNRAQEAVDISDGAAPALELRGVIRYELAEAAAQGQRWRRGAMEDLQAAVRQDPRRARALAYLGLARRFAGDFAAARSYAERALEVDAYLEEADRVLNLLYATSFELKRWAEADHWCREGRRRYPDSLPFAFCRLQFEALRPDTVPPPTAWALRDTIREMAPPEDWELGYRSWAGYKVATVLARNGLADSALAVLADHRPEEDEEARYLAYDEAYVRLSLGDDSGALDLLEAYLEVRPDRRTYLPSDWMFEALWDHPRFKAMTSGGAARSEGP